MTFGSMNTGISLWPFQQEIVDTVSSKLVDWSSGLGVMKKIMLQMPTGSGKTECAMSILSQFPEKYHGHNMRYWMTYGIDLEAQSTYRIEESGIGEVVVFSPVRLWNQIESGKKVILSGSVLVVDEAHHTPSKTWYKILDYWPGPVLGLTATPWRMSTKEGFDNIFDELVVGPTVQELIDMKYLVPTIVKHPMGEVIKGVGNSAGDYSRNKTWEDGNKTTLVEAGVKWLLKERKANSKTIVYCVNVPHAKSVYEYALKRGLKAALLLGETPKAERKKINEGFRGDLYDTLITVDVVTEGYDVRGADMLLVLRPTRSLVMWLQMCGRVMRIDEGKTHAVILDAAENWQRHGLPEDVREWTLTKRSRGGRGEAPTRICQNWQKGVKCNTVNHAAVKACVHCGFAFGALCQRCGKFAMDIKKGQQCPACNEAAQNALFYGEDGKGQSGSSGVWRGHPFFIKRKRSWGGIIHKPLEKPSQNDTLILKAKNGKTWKSKIARVAWETKEGSYVCELK